MSLLRPWNPKCSHCIIEGISLKKALPHMCGHGHSSATCDKCEASQRHAAPPAAEASQKWPPHASMPPLAHEATLPRRRCA